MSTEKLACFRVKDSFNHSLWLSQCNRLAISKKGEPTDTDIVANISCLRFSEADTGNLWGTIGATSNTFRFYRMWLTASNQFSYHHSLMAGLVSQPRSPSYITDSVNSLNTSASISIGFDMTIFDNNTQGFQPQIFNITHNSNGRDYSVKGFSGNFTVLFNVGFNRAHTSIQLFNNSIGLNFHTLLLEGFLSKS